MKYSKLNEVPDISELEHGTQFRNVVLLLWKNMRNKRETPLFQIKALGSEATKRAREVRLGLQAKLLADEGLPTMLWVDSPKLHGGNYVMRPITWEEWVKLRGDIDDKEFQKNKAKQITLIERGRRYA